MQREHHRGGAQVHTDTQCHEHTPRQRHKVTARSQAGRHILTQNPGTSPRPHPRWPHRHGIANCREPPRIPSQGRVSHTVRVTYPAPHVQLYNLVSHWVCYRLNNVTGLYMQCHRTSQSVGPLTPHSNPWPSEASHQPTTHCTDPFS